LNFSVRGSAADPPRIRRGSAADLPRIRRGSAADSPRIRRGFAADSPRIRRGSAADPPRIRRGFAADSPRIRRGFAADPPQSIQFLEHWIFKGHFFQFFFKIFPQNLYTFSKFFDRFFLSDFDHFRIFG
jgi:hypothetical protein